MHQRPHSVVSQQYPKQQLSQGMFSWTEYSNVGLIINGYNVKREDSFVWKNIHWMYSYKYNKVGVLDGVLRDLRKA